MTAVPSGAGRRRRSRLRLFSHLADHRRHAATDFLLALLLAFVAGGINAGGVIAIGRYTSHMTGYVSELADNIALVDLALVLSGLGAITAFIAGAAVSAILIHWARRHTRWGQYAMPLALEAVLLLAFGAAGMALGDVATFVAVATFLLCFLMGLQNATITKISGARMRTTHVTGIVTDIGIELGKALYRNADPNLPASRHVRADRKKLAMLSSIVASFLVGGIIGALGFAWIGYAFTLPLALILLGCALPNFIARGRYARLHRASRSRNG